MVSAGSLLCGALIAGFVLLLMGVTKDHLVEMTFSIVAAYGSFLTAEHFHLSGVLATLTAGLIIGNVGHLAISSAGRRAVVELWEFAAFVANSLIFLLIGMRVTSQSYRPVLLPAAIAIVVVTLGRALAIYPLSLVFAKSGRKIKPTHQHILFWGGLRGALALALALGLPPDMAQRQEIITVAFAVVAFSILVQGMTIAPVLRRTASEDADQA
jgi:CPA1 family monovalent cation:H+ antiporter